MTLASPEFWGCQCNWDAFSPVGSPGLSSWTLTPLNGASTFLHGPFSPGALTAAEVYLHRQPFSRNSRPATQCQAPDALCDSFPPSKPGRLIQVHLPLQGAVLAPTFLAFQRRWKQKPQPESQSSSTQPPTLRFPPSCRLPHLALPPSREKAITV